MVDTRFDESSEVNRNMGGIGEGLRQKTEKKSKRKAKRQGLPQRSQRGHGGNGELMDMEGLEMRQRNDPGQSKEKADPSQKRRGMTDGFR